MKKFLLTVVLLALTVISCQKNEKSYPGSYSYNSTITVGNIIGGSSTYTGFGQMHILSHSNSDTLSIMMQTILGAYREFQAVDNDGQLDIVPYSTTLNIPIPVQVNITGGSIFMRTEDIIQIREEFRTLLGDTGSMITIAERN